MSELRLDRLRGVWAIVAPGRRGASEPRAVRSPATLPRPAGPCPFCPGNEAETERERLRLPAEGPWQVRVVDNRYPILPGRHELLIEHSAHDLDLPDFGPGELTLALLAARDRLRTLAALEGVEEVVFFRNRGVRAGSSQPHPHSQLVALPRISNERARRQALASEHARRQGGSLLRAILEEEVLDGERLLLCSPRLVAYCPSAPQRPGLIRVAPRSGEGSFLELEGAALGELAVLLRALLSAQREVSGGAAYNLLLHEPPVAQAPGPARFWVLEIVPRLSGWAGFELVTGVDILLATPEQSAAELKASEALRSAPPQNMP